MKKLNVGWIVAALLSIMPIVIWFLTPRNSSFPLNIQNIIIGFGEIFGLVGIVMFSLNFILATRLPFIEKLFGGLNNVYKKHNLLGQIAFVLLLFHPLFLLPRYASDFREGASFLFLGSTWDRNFGIIALWTMIVLVVLTLYLRPKYDLWKITHKFFGTALFFGGLHVYFAPGYVMQNLLLKSYVLFFAVLGLIAFLYRSVFGKYLIKRYQYVVEGVRLLNPKVVEISLRPLKNRLSYRPGQFLFISFEKKELAESHPFSVSSAPDEELLKITVKNLGDYTEKLFSMLGKGIIAEVEGPFGTFSYAKTKNKNQIWISGGIGITPFLSFAKSIKKDSRYNITLFYCAKSESEAVYFDWLKELAEKNCNFSVVPFYSSQKGHIDAEYLSANIKDIAGKDVFICAPTRMIRELKNDLIGIGIDRNNIHSEEFSF